MLQDLIDHIRDPETQYQIASATAAIFGITACAIPVVRNFRELAIIRIDGNSNLTYDDVYSTRP